MISAFKGEDDEELTVKIPGRQKLPKTEILLREEFKHGQSIWSITDE